MSSTTFVLFGLIVKLRWPPWPLIGWVLRNHWMEFNETWEEVRPQRPLPSLYFFRADRFVFFGPIGKTRWPPWPLIGWDIFDFSSETAEQNLTKLDRKQDLNVLYQVCVFQADGKNKMAALASDLLRHFWLLLWNCWTEFNKTWQEARYQCSLPSLCFSGRSEKQDGRPGLWLAETFSTSPLRPLNGIWRNLTESKISTSSTKFVFFWVNLKNKMAALVSDWLRHFWLLLWNRWTELDETDWKQDLNVLNQVCIFWSGRKKLDGCPGQTVKKVAHCTQVHDMWPFGPLVCNWFRLFIFFFAIGFVFIQLGFPNRWKIECCIL